MLKRFQKLSNSNVEEVEAIAVVKHSKNSFLLPAGDRHSTGRLGKTETTPSGLWGQFLALPKCARQAVDSQAKRDIRPDGPDI